MEGIGSRTGRPSSRYGSAPVFTGPVRRWQKQWVNVSSSSSSITYNHTNTSNSKGTNNNNNSDVSSIRIRRWTPVSSANSGGDSESEERPKRKIRYAPIVVLDGKKKEAERGDVDVKEVSKPNKSPAQETLENDDNDKQNFDDALAAKPQASQKNEEATKDLNSQPMDSDAGGDDDDDEDHDLGGDNKVADWVKAAQRGFAP
ncbi:hypothetical protein M8C21_031538 [Ambrosia artemisiifolia]|uniref:Uncharacterized protein n=1 Tax=Ambrosia artemisiifolia TaxID=4212 RepID=A0AAD5CNI5_AMBAR|nr:hypothetical protein M8C21_031538 [Ambrosia artemisiifolia]